MPEQVFRLPDGNYIRIPDGFTDKDWTELGYELAERYPEIAESFYPGQRTALGQAGSFLTGVPRGIASIPVSAARGVLGVLTPGIDTGVERGLEKAGEWLGGDPAYRDTWANKVGMGIGSAIPFMGAAMLPGLAPAMALGAATGAGEQATRISALQQASGENIGFLPEVLATTIGGAIGTTEAFPFKGIASQIPGVKEAAKIAAGNKLVAGQLAAGKNMMADLMAKVPKAREGSLLNLIPTALGRAIIEGSQEAGSALAQDLTARGLYDPHLEVGESWLDEFTVGAVVGGLFGAAVPYMADASGRKAAGQKALEAMERRRNRWSQLEARVQRSDELEREELQRARAASEKVEQGTFEFYGKGFSITPSPTGAGLTVIDNETGLAAKDLPVFGSEGEAQHAIAKLERNQRELAFLGTNRLLLDAQGLGESMTAFRIGNAVNNPDLMVPLAVAAQYDGSLGNTMELVRGAGGRIKGQRNAAADRFLAKHPELKGRSVLTNAEVLKALSKEDAESFLVDRAVLRAASARDLSLAADEALVKNGGVPTVTKEVSRDAIRGMTDAKRAAHLTEVLKSRKKYQTYLAALLDERNITLSTGTDTLLDKKYRIKAPEFAFVARSLVGTDNVSQMSDGQKMYLMSSLLEVSPSPNPVPFPDLAPLRYTPNQRDAVLKVLGETKLAKKGQVALGEIVNEATSKANTVLGETEKLMPDATEQLLRHAMSSGKTPFRLAHSEGKPMVLLGRTEKVAERRAPGVEAELYGTKEVEGLIPEMTKGSKPEAKDRTKRFLIDTFIKKDVDDATEGKPPHPNTPAERADYVIENFSKQDKVHERLKARLAQFALAPGNAKVGVLLATPEEMARKSAAIMDAANGRRPVWEAAYDALENKIFPDLAALDPEGDLSVDEITAKAEVVLDEEIFHTLAQRGYFFDSEIESLERAVSRIVVPEAVDRDAHREGKTWLARAKERYHDLTEPAQIEEAMAKYFSAVNQGHVKGQQSHSMLDALKRNLPRIIRAHAEVDDDLALRSSLRVISRIRNREVGERGPGFAYNNQEAVIRDPEWSARRYPTTEDVAATKEALGRVGTRVSESPAGVGMPPIGSEVGEAVYPGRIAETPAERLERTGAEVTIPEFEGHAEGMARIVAGIAPPAARLARGVEAAPASTDERQLGLPDWWMPPVVEKADAPAAYQAGLEPQVNPNASPVAIKAFYDAMRSGLVETLPPEARATFSIRPAVNKELDALGRLTDYELPHAKTMAERVIAFLDSPDKFSDLKTWLDRTGIRARYEGLHRDAPPETYGHRAEQAQGRKVLADESAYGAIVLMKQNANSVFGTVFHSGPVDYEASEGVMRGMLNFTGHGFVTEDGTEYSGVTDIANRTLISNDGKETYEQDAHDLLIAARSLAILEVGRRSKALKDAKAYANDAELKQLERDIAKANAPLPGGKTKADYEKILEIARRNPKLVEFEKAHIATERWLQKFMVATEQIDPNSHVYKQWVEFPHYVPFTQDQVDAWQAPVVMGRQRRKRNILIEKERKGAANLIDTPLMESWAGNIHGIIMDGINNIVRNRSVRDLRILGVAHDVKEGDPVHLNDITFFEKGAKRRVRTDDPMLASSLMSANMALDMGPLLETLMLGPKRVAQKLITMDPTFMVKQAIRDPISGYGTSGAWGESPGGFARMMKDYYTKLFDDSAYREAREKFISLGHDYDSSPKRVRQALDVALRQSGSDSRGVLNPAQVIGKAFDALSNFSLRQEAAIRMAVYRKVLDATKNEAEARFQAREVINFGRRGANPWLAYVTAMVPFLNARLQGLDVMWRSHTGQYTAINENLTKQQIAGRAMARGAYLLAMTLGYWMLWQRDEEEYKNIRREVREDNFVFPGLDGTYFRLPIPFEVGVVYKAIPELFLNALSDDADTRLASGLLRQFKQSAGMSPLPQVVEPAVGAFMNRNMYTGSPIVPFFMEQGREPRDRYTHDTNRVAVEAGQRTGLNPMKIEYLISNYLPGMGEYASAMADMIARSVRGESSVGTRSDLGSPLTYPGLRGITTRKGGGYQQEFYDLQKEVTQLVGSLNSLKREGKVEELRVRREMGMDLLNVRGRVNRLSNYMEKWNERRAALLRMSEITETDRRDRLKALEDERDLELSIVPLLKEIARGSRTK